MEGDSLQTFKILALETSCDETAAAVVDSSYRVHSSVVSSQIEFHRRFGGVVPEIASRKHVENINFVIEQALEEAQVALKDIDVIAATRGPGLIGALLVGMTAAKALAFVLNKPVVFVDHIEAHIWSNFLDGQNPELPALALVVSGGHTSFYFLNRQKKLKLLGETIDDAVGEAFDKVAKMLDLPYPGGPHIEKVARHASNPPEFPRPMIDSDDLNFSFSGLKTAVLYYLKKHPEASVADVAAGFQQAIIDVLVKKTEKALEKYPVRSVLLAGGVVANRALRESFIKFADEKGITVSFPQFKYCTDNAAMIGARAVDHVIRGEMGDFRTEAYSITRTAV